MTKVKDHLMELIQDENLDATMEVVIKDDENSTYELGFTVETTFDGSYISLVAKLDHYTVIDTPDLKELKEKADLVEELQQEIKELKETLADLEE